MRNTNALTACVRMWICPCLRPAATARIAWRPTRSPSWNSQTSPQKPAPLASPSPNHSFCSSVARVPRIPTATPLLPTWPQRNLRGPEPIRGRGRDRMVCPCLEWLAVTTLAARGCIRRQPTARSRSMRPSDRPASTASSSAARDSSRRQNPANNNSNAGPTSNP